MALESLERLLLSASSAQPRRYPIKRIAAALSLFAILLAFYSLSRSRRTPEPLQEAVKPLFLSVLIPSRRDHDVELCKTVVTAQILNYPVPVVIASEGQDVASKRETAPTSRDGLRHALAYLKDLPPEAEDGIVILLNGPGALFQLRPDVLLQRYFRILKEANVRVKSVGGHSVVVPAHSICSERSENPACSATSGQASAQTGHGVIVGPAGHVRDLLLAALSREGGKPLFAHIFQEQQLHGQWFGICPDYANDLSAPITANDTWTASEVMSAEVRGSTPPFWTVLGDEEGLPHTSGWDDVQLFTTSATRTTPALLYHSASDDESVKKQSWGQLWMQPHARTLYTAAQLLPQAAVASVNNADGVEQVFWNRGAKNDKAGVYVATPGKEQEWVRWADICGGEEQWKEVFRDERGAWEGSVPFFW